MEKHKKKIKQRFVRLGCEKDGIIERHAFARYIIDWKIGAQQRAISTYLPLKLFLVSPTSTARWMESRIGRVKTMRTSWTAPSKHVPHVVFSNPISPS